MIRKHKCTQLPQTIYMKYMPKITITFSDILRRYGGLSHKCIMNSYVALFLFLYRNVLDVKQTYPYSDYLLYKETSRVGYIHL